MPHDSAFDGVGTRAKSASFDAKSPRHSLSLVKDSKFPGLRSDDGPYGRYEFRTSLSTSGGAFSMRVRFR
jgi:hypothetical protein